MRNLSVWRGCNRGVSDLLLKERPVKAALVMRKTFYSAMPFQIRKHLLRTDVTAAPCWLWFSER